MDSTTILCYTCMLVVFSTYATGQHAGPDAPACPSHFNGHFGRSCYKWFTTQGQADWVQATMYCQSIQARLVNIETLEEDVYLTELLTNLTSSHYRPGLSLSVWTSGNNFRGSWQWAERSSVGAGGLEITYHPWAAEQPYNSTSRLLCIVKRGHAWITEGCAAHWPFMCEMELDGYVGEPSPGSGEGNKEPVG
ncbi:hypothetical protein ScPMuIL_009555 [Solemya velum]